MKSSVLLTALLVCAVSAYAKAPTSAPAVATKALRKPPQKAVVKPAPLPPLLDASEEQMAAADRAYLGQYDCEFKQSVDIAPHPKPGYVNVTWAKQVFTMKPVLSSTGALRLEDVTGRTLMIQIANKSMLLDTRIGQRLVDDCLHPAQRAAIEAARVAKAAAVAEAAASGIAIVADTTGLGIKPNN
jgi:hypothetical protein